MRQLYRKNVSDQSLTFYLPSGSFGGFMLAYEGTNGAGNTANRDDMGQVLFNHNGSPVIDCDAEFLSFLNDLKGGFSTFASAIGGAFECFIYLPCGDFKDKNNCYTIDQKDSIYFKLDFSALSALLASGTVTIYGIPKEGIQNYVYCIAQRNVVAQGAGRVSDVHRLDNVFSMYVKDYSAVNRIMITRDGQNLFDVETNTAQALSDFFNQVEATVSIIELDLNLSKDVKEMLSREILFDYNFTGASTLSQYFAYKSFTPNKATQSRVISQQKLQAKVSQGIVKQVPVLVPIEPAMLGRATAIDQKN